MKKTQLVVCGILATVLALAFAACRSPADSALTTGSIAGNVVFPSGSDGATISIHLKTMEDQLTASVNVSYAPSAGGSFRFDDLDPGIFALYVSLQDSLERSRMRTVTVTAGGVYPVGTININLGCNCGTIPQPCGCSHGNVGCGCDLGGLGCGCTHGDVGCGCTHGDVGCGCTHGDVGCGCDLGDLGCGCTHGDVGCGCTHGDVGCGCDLGDLGCGCTHGDVGCGCDLGGLGCGCTHGDVGCGCTHGDVGCGCTHGDVGCGCTHGDVGCNCTHGDVGCTCAAPVAALTIVGSGGTSLSSLALVVGQYYTLYAKGPNGEPITNVLWDSDNPNVLSVHRNTRFAVATGPSVQIRAGNAMAGNQTATITATSLGGSDTLVEAYVVVTVNPPSFTISFTDLTDRAYGILDIGNLSLLYLSRTPATITLDNPNGHAFNNIEWLFDGVDIGDGTETLVLGASVNGQVLRIGEHFMTVLLEIDGRPYSNRIAFRVTL